MFSRTGGDRGSVRKRKAWESNHLMNEGNDDDGYDDDGE